MFGGGDRYRLLQQKLPVLINTVQQKQTFRVGARKGSAIFACGFGLLMIAPAVGLLVSGDVRGFLFLALAVAFFRDSSVRLSVSGARIRVHNYWKTVPIEASEFRGWTFLGPKPGLRPLRRCRFEHEDGRTVYCSAVAANGRPAKRRDDLVTLESSLRSVGIRVQREIRI